jgi:hypothetical protein
MHDIHMLGRVLRDAHYLLMLMLHRLANRSQDPIRQTINAYMHGCVLHDARDQRSFVQSTMH